MKDEPTTAKGKRPTNAWEGFLLLVCVLTVVLGFLWALVALIKWAI